MSKLNNKRQLKAILLDLLEHCDTNDEAFEKLSKVSEIVGCGEVSTPTSNKATYVFNKSKLEISQNNETCSFYVPRHMVNRVAASIDAYNKSDSIIPMSLIVPYSLIKQHYDIEKKTIAGLPIDALSCQRLLQIVITNWDSRVIDVLYSDDRDKFLNLLDHETLNLSNTVFLPETREIVCYMNALIDKRGDRLPIIKGKVTVPSVLLPTSGIDEAFCNFIRVRTEQDGFPVKVRLADILDISDSGLVVSSISL